MLNDTQEHAVLVHEQHLTLNLVQLKHLLMRTVKSYYLTEKKTMKGKQCSYKNYMTCTTLQQFDHALVHSRQPLKKVEGDINQ